MACLVLGKHFCLYFAARIHVGFHPFCVADNPVLCCISLFYSNIGENSKNRIDNNDSRLSPIGEETESMTLKVLKPDIINFKNKIIGEG